MLKKFSFIKKIFAKSVTIWLMATGVYSGGILILLNMLHGMEELWKFLIGVVAICVSGILFAVYASPYRGKKITVAPTDSVKELLDNIVNGYSNGPYTVINLEYNTFPLRDAVCKRLNQELFEGIFKEAAEEVGGTLGNFTFADKPIDCELNRIDGEANAGIRNIQVTPK